MFNEKDNDNEIVYLQRDEFRKAFNKFRSDFLDQLLKEDDYLDKGIDLHFGSPEDYNLINKKLECTIGKDGYYSLYSYRFPNPEDCPIVLEVHLYVVCKEKGMIYFDSLYKFFANLDIHSIEFKSIGQNELMGMSYAFANLSEIRNIDISCFNIGKVQNMSHMFYNCKKLRNVKLDFVDAGEVDDMSYMFGNCINLSFLDFKLFQTSSYLKNLEGIFSNCYNLRELDLRSFIVKNVKNMSAMFSNCIKLRYIDLSSFDTRSAIDMSCMFSFCVSLREINLRKFDTLNVKYMNNMFSGCHSLVHLDLSNFNTKNVQTMSRMFQLCSNLTTLDIVGFELSSVDDVSYMFSKCFCLEKIIVKRSFNINDVRNNDEVFSLCMSLRGTDIELYKYENFKDQRNKGKFLTIGDKEYE